MARASASIVSTRPPAYVGNAAPHQRPSPALLPASGEVASDDRVVADPIAQSNWRWRAHSGVAIVCRRWRRALQSRGDRSNASGRSRVFEDSTRRGSCEPVINPE